MSFFGMMNRPNLGSFSRTAASPPQQGAQPYKSGGPGGGGGMFGRVAQRPAGMGGGQAQAMGTQQGSPYAKKQPGAGYGGAAAMGAAMGSMMSDENSKREIKQLESANEALTKALSSKAEYPDTTSRSAGMQALGQQAVPPSRADFPDAPADAVADRVAAQNVALQQGQQAPQQAAAAPMAQPGQSDIRNPWGVQTTMPNLSDLDEAYARMGRGG